MGISKNPHLSSRVAIGVFAGLFAALSIAAPAARAEDRVELKSTTIIGNSELPKLLFIAPWQPLPYAQDLPPPPRLDSGALLRPLDRAVFRRGVEK